MSEAKSAWLAKGVFDVKAPSGTLLGLRFPEPEDAVIAGGVDFRVAGQVKRLREQAQASGVDLDDEEALGEAIGGDISADQARNVRLMNYGWIIAAVVAVDGDETELSPAEVPLIPTADRALIMKFAQRQFDSENPEDVAQAEELGLPKDAFSPRLSSGSVSPQPPGSTSVRAIGSASTQEPTSETA